METVKNAALYRCKVCRRGGPNDLDADVRRFKVDPERPKYREARCAEHAPGEVAGVRARPGTNATSTEHYGEALRSVTAEEIATLHKAARGRIARERLGSHVAEDLFDVMLDRFVTLCARNIGADTPERRDEALGSACKAHVNLSGEDANRKIAAPVNAETPGVQTLALTFEGFGDGFRRDVLDLMEPADALVLECWAEMASTEQASSADPTAWREGRFRDVYAEVTTRVQSAALAYLETRAYVDAHAA